MIGRSVYPATAARQVAVTSLHLFERHMGRGRWAFAHDHNTVSSFVAGGVGEPTISVVTAAVLNASVAATGKPVRSLPLKHVKLA
jgi:hypothetical protein